MKFPVRDMLALLIQDSNYQRKKQNKTVDKFAQAKQFFKEEKITPEISHAKWSSFKTIVRHNYEWCRKLCSKVC